MLQCRLPKAKYVAFGAVWYLGLALLVALSTTHRDLSAPSIALESGETIAPENQIKSFRLTRCSPGQNKTPSFGLSFDSLTTENGNLGIFKTAMQRTLQIEGLRVAIYRYDLSELSDPMGIEDSADIKYVTDYYREELGRLFDGDRQDNPYRFRLGVDFRNLAQLLVIGFQFDRFINDALSLQIKSGTAQTHFGQPGLVLQGHVVLRASDQVVLQSNHVVWDIKNQTFTAKGLYALTRNGINKTGRNICLDMNLNEVSASQTQSTDEKESFPCYAQAF